MTPGPSGPSTLKKKKARARLRRGSARDTGRKGNESGQRHLPARQRESDRRVAAVWRNDGDQRVLPARQPWERRRAREHLPLQANSNSIFQDGCHGRGNSVVGVEQAYPVINQCRGQ